MCLYRYVNAICHWSEKTHAARRNFPERNTRDDTHPFVEPTDEIYTHHIQHPCYDETSGDPSWRVDSTAITVDRKAVIGHPANSACVRDDRYPGNKCSFGLVIFVYWFIRVLVYWSVSVRRLAFSLCLNSYNYLFWLIKLCCWDFELIVRYSFLCSKKNPLNLVISLPLDRIIYLPSLLVS